MDVLKKIESRSLSLEERKNLLKDRKEIFNKDLVKQRLNEWKKLFKVEEKDYFEKRVQLEGGEEKLSYLLDDLSPQEINAISPTWSLILNQILKASLKEGIHSYLDEKAPIPFQELLLPFLSRFEREIKDISNFSPAVFIQLGLEFLKSLSKSSTKTLYEEFRMFRAFEKLEKLDDFNLFEDETSSSEIYQKFIAQYQGEKALSLYEKYSTLAKDMVLATENWIKNIRELSQHIEQDRKDLSEIKGTKDETWHVTAIHLGEGDSHHGKSVTRIEFSTGKSLFYKPRRSYLDGWFYDFMDELNDRGLNLPLPKISLLSRDTYHWVTEVAFTNYTTEEQVRNAYLNNGRMLAIIYLLKGVDFHFENIIQSNQAMVPIDLECLFVEGIKQKTDESDKEMILEDLERGLIGTLLIPMDQFELEGNLFEIHGMGGCIESKKKIERLVNINTDQMEMGASEVNIPAKKNLILLQDKKTSPQQYLEEIIQGFEEVYTFFQNHAEEILSAPIFNERLKGKRARFVARGTAKYGKLLSYTADPKYTQEGIDRSILIDVLMIYRLEDQAEPEFIYLGKEEVSQAEEGEIPFFEVDVCKGNILSREMPIFTTSIAPIDEVKKHLRSLSQSKLDKLVYTLRFIFFSRHSHCVYEEIAHTAQRDLSVSLQKIYEHILNRKLLDKNSKSIWPKINIKDDKSASLKESLEDLYEGRAGIALFLASANHYLKDKERSKEVKNLINELLQEFNRAPREYIDRDGIGAMLGCGGLVYLLTRAGMLFDEPQWIEAAKKIVFSITDEDVANDKILDVIKGSAGLILVLVALYKVTLDKEVLAVARRVRDHLLTLSQKDSEGRVYWITITPSPLLGVSHGSSGILYALYCLNQIDPWKEFEEIYPAVLQFEEHHYQPHEKGFPDYRSEEASCVNTWCHGRSGHILLRASMKEDIEKKNLDTHILDMLPPLDLFKNAIDMYCCGSLSLVDMYLALEESHPAHGYKEHALDVIKNSLDRAGKQGFTYHHQEPIKAVMCFSLMRGLSGVGYALLRCLDKSYPSILKLEA